MTAIEAKAVHLFVGAVAFVAMLLENRLDVADEIHFGGGRGLLRGRLADEQGSDKHE